MYMTGASAYRDTLKPLLKDIKKGSTNPESHGEEERFQTQAQ